MSSTLTILGGIILLLIGGGLTLYSYVNRDPVTGEYFIWFKTILVGAVMTVAGLIHRHMENQPL
ncbi:MAG TPA: hypothetical protein VKX17_18960 [Planctomycetota bacterium]|nr:hypothetical protein [Planctomycetota bacterium]